MLEQLESGGDKDDKIIVQVNRKVEEWKVRTHTKIPTIVDIFLQNSYSWSFKDCELCPSPLSVLCVYFTSLFIFLLISSNPFQSS